MGPYCAVGAQRTPAGGVICGDIAELATCVAGQWTCSASSVPFSQCTCNGNTGPHCDVCTASGWSCVDAGVDGAGDAASCSLGCGPTGRVSPFCASNNLVDWVCATAADERVLLASGCLDQATNLPRYCCSPSFMPQCPVMQ